MARHRDFGTPADMSKEPVSFTMGGEQFDCLPEAPSGALNDLVAGVSYNDDGDRVYSAPNLIEFVCQVLREHEAIAVEGDALNDAELEILTPDEARAQNIWVPAQPDGSDPEKVAIMPTNDVQRFRALMRDKRRPVPIDQLGDLVIWLSEELGNRPTPPSASSPRGRR